MTETLAFAALGRDVKLKQGRKNGGRGDYLESAWMESVFDDSQLLSSILGLRVQAATLPRGGGFGKVSCCSLLPSELAE